MKNIYILVISLVLLGYSEISAQDGAFNVTVIQHDIEGPQLGEVAIEATGTAGPFELIIEGHDETFGVGRSWMASDLPAGNYVASFTIPGSGCAFEEPFQILSCPEITVFIQSPVIVEPSDCSMNDGEFSARWFSASPNGQYSYHFEDQDGNVIPSASSFSKVYENLSIGTYCAVATDQNGCFGKKCFEIETDALPFSILSDVVPACQNSASGSIYLLATPNSDESGFYDFEWSNGALTENAEESNLHSLTPGVYSVTITNTQSRDCEIIKEFIVGSEEIEAIPLVVTQTRVTQPCEGATGAIRLTPSGGVLPREISWNDGDQYGYHRNNLASGNYCYTVTDRCGQSESDCISIQELQVEIEETIEGCGNGQLTAVVQGGAPPYTYHWAHEGPVSREATVENVESGDVRLIVTDSRDCRITEFFEYNTNGISYESDDPCQGFNDGSIEITIHNRGQESGRILLDGAVVHEFEGNNDGSSFTINNLTADGGIQDYELKVEFESCEKSYTVRLRERFPEREFSSYDEDAQICTFEQSCRGVGLGDLADHEEPVFWDPGAGRGGNFESRCGYPGFCGDVEVDFDRVNTEVVSVFEMEQLINRLEGCLSSDLINAARAGIAGEDGCQTVRYCPADLSILSRPFSFGGTPVVEITGSNCFTMRGCGFFGIRTRRFCTEEHVTDRHREICGDTNPNVILPNCNPISLNARMLVSWHVNGLFEQLTDVDYENSGLGRRLQEISENPSLINGSWCSSIIFCRNNFAIIGDDVSSFNDTPPVNSTTPGVFTVRCERPCTIAEINTCDGEACRCFDISVVNLRNEIFDPNIFNSLAPTTGPENEFLLLDEFVFDDEITESFVISGGIKSPSLVINSGVKNTHISYSGKSKKYTYRDIGKTVRFLDSHDENILYLLNKNSDDSYEVIVKDEHGEYTTSIKTTGGIDIDVFDVVEEQLIIAGNTSGGLYVNDALSKGFSERGGFIIKLDANDLSLADVTSIENSKNDVEYIVDDKGIYASAVKDVKSLKASNGHLLNTGKGQYLLSVTGERVAVPGIDFGNNGVVFASENDENFNYSIIKGMNSLVSTKGDLIGDTPNKFSLVRTSLKESKSEGGSMVDLLSEQVIIENAEEIINSSLEIGKEGTVFFSLSFTNRIGLQKKSFGSAGLMSTLILKLDMNGLLSIHELEVDGDVEVKGMTLLNDMLILTGNFDNISNPFVFGEKTIVPAYQNLSTPFLLAVNAQDFKKMESKELRSESIEEEFVRGPSVDLKVFPNPSNGNFRLTMNTTTNENVEYLEVRNLFGKLVETIKVENANRDRMEMNVDLSDVKGGVYILSARLNSGKIISEKIVIQ